MSDKIKKRFKYSKYISIIHRLSYPYFDRELGGFHIGGGQQFFLLAIYEFPGISMLELARQGNYDKGTTNRAVVKLAEQGYITISTDNDDKRIRRLYLTDKAIPIIEKTYDVLSQWNHILTENLTWEEKKLAEKLIKNMSQNAYNFMTAYRERRGKYEE